MFRFLRERILTRLLAIFQRLASRSAFFAALFAGIIAALVAILNPVDDGLDDAAVAGAWILEVDGRAELYCVLDGAGGVTTASNFFNDGGSYSVASDGAFDMSWNQTGGSPIVFGGTFTSETAGTFDQPKAGELTKVPDVGAMAGQWYARYERTVDVTTTSYASFTVGDDGAITASGGDLELTGGHIFLADGGVVMHGITTETDDWGEFGAIGTGDAQLVTGDLDLDSEYDVDGSFTFQREPFDLFDEAAVAGAWMLRVAGDPALYVILDGAGGVNTASNFFNDGGSYSVDGDGGFTISLAEAGASPVVIGGTFDDDSSGTFSTPATGTIDRIDDPGAMAGLWYAEWRNQTSSADQTYLGSFTVDASGAIVDSEGPLALTGGYCLLDGSGVVMHATTTETDRWIEIGCLGSGTTTQVTGRLELDTGNASDGSFTFTRSLPITTASVEGPWLLQIGGQAEQYVIFDGSGGLVASNFFNTGGSYSVAGGGSLSMTWTSTDGSLAFSGSFTSPFRATVSGPASGTLIKVHRPGALAGTWGGDMVRVTQSGGTRSLTFTVDDSGAITGSSGDLIITSGHAFLEDGQVAIHARTTSTDQWSEFGARGTGDTSSLSGDFDVDSSYDDDGDFTFTNPPPTSN